jgi:hypothetical protein
LPYESTKNQIREIVEVLKMKPELSETEEKGSRLWEWIKNTMY